MRHRFVAALALLTGCGSGSAALASRQTTAPPTSAAESPAQSRIPPREVVRIGGGHTASAEEVTEIVSDDVALDEPESPEDSRPMLRLYGTSRPASSTEGVTPYPGSAPPGFVSAPPSVAAFGRLPPMTTPDVPAIPTEPLVIIEPEESRPALADDAIVREYQAALTHVEARRFDEAIRSLSRFVTAHPEHSYADNALYWQGEAHYARREYRQAIEVLERMVARYPDGNKVPDALVRIGDAFEHLGDRAQARAYFRRVREQFPDSVAARTARREEI